MNKKHLLISILCITALLISGCSTPGDNTGPTFTNIDVPNVAATNAPYILSAETDQEADIEFDCGRGEFIYKADNQADWRAPASGGDAVITIKATNDNGEITLNEETITVKQAPDIKITHEILIKNGESLVEIFIENNTQKEITHIQLNLVGWKDDKRIATDDDYTFDIKKDTSISNGEKNPLNKLYNLNTFETIPTESNLEAYVTFVEYNNGEDSWRLK